MPAELTRKAARSSLTSIPCISVNVRIQRIGTSASLISIVLALGTSGCTAGRTQQTGNPSASERPASPEPTTSSAEEGPLVAGDSLVVATLRGEVLELGSADGRIRRALAGPEETGGPPGHLAVAAGGRTIYFDRGRPGCWAEFSYLGGTGVAGEGAWPTPDRQGGHIAALGGSDPCRPDVVFAYDVASGRRERFSGAHLLATEGAHFRGPLSWSSDGTQLAIPVSDGKVLISLPTPGQPLSGWTIMATRQGGSAAAAFFVEVGGVPQLLVLEACCGSSPASWFFERRRLQANSVGPPRDAFGVPKPMAITVRPDGEITLTASTRTVFVGRAPILRRLPGEYVAAD